MGNEEQEQILRVLGWLLSALYNCRRFRAHVCSKREAHQIIWHTPGSLIRQAGASLAKGRRLLRLLFIQQRVSYQKDSQGDDQALVGQYTAFREAKLVINIQADMELLIRLTKRL